MFKYYVTQGYIVIMKDLEPIYPNLYDLFNQRFILSGSDFRYCNISFENRSGVIQIHKDFRCIIIKNENDLFTKAADLEAKLPSPLMNRFEKHILNLKDLKNKSRRDSRNRGADRTGARKTFADVPAQSLRYRVEQRKLFGVLR